MNINNIADILLIVMGLFGGGGLVALWRAGGTRAVREARLDRVADTVLGRADDPKDEGLIAVVRHHTEQLDQLLYVLTPNGGYGKHVGDVALRTENAVKALDAKVTENIGANEEAHRGFRRQLDAQGRRLRELSK
jgi:hypothetical protein